MNNARKLHLLEIALAYSEVELSRHVAARDFSAVGEITLRVRDYWSWIEELQASPETRTDIETPESDF